MEPSPLSGILDIIDKKLAIIAGYVWDLPLAIALVSIGLIFTLTLGFPQIRGFCHAIKVIMGKYDDDDDPGEISHFQALCMALSATVGLGNIAGVSVAIHTGGPGAVFWMVLTGLVGMSTKYVECSLAVMYRKIDAKGRVFGGPMYYIVRGLGEKWRPLAIFFSIGCIFAAFGAGNMFQANQVATLFKGDPFNIPTHICGLLLAILTAIVIIGGVKRIGQVASRLVPFMGGIYILGGLTVILTNFQDIPGLFLQIVDSAFSGSAAIGGAAGIAVKEVIKQGVRRACFSNEAGLGSAAIAHSTASTKEPIREGVVALLEPFIDTVLVCTTTALVILASGVPYWELNGVELTAAAFDSVIPGFGMYFVPIAAFLFAYSTLLSWSYYGQQVFVFLFGEKEGFIMVYKTLFCTLIVVGAIWKLTPILNFSDIMLGLMAIPNLIAIGLLLPQVKKASKDYFDRLAAKENK